MDKESLIDIMYTLSKKAGISDKDYRMWYKLNEDTEIAVRTSVGNLKPRSSRTMWDKAHSEQHWRPQ